MGSLRDESAPPSVERAGPSTALGSRVAPASGHSRAPQSLAWATRVCDLNAFRLGESKRDAILYGDTHSRYRVAHLSLVKPAIAHTAMDPCPLTDADTDETDAARARRGIVALCL